MKRESSSLRVKMPLAQRLLSLPSFLNSNLSSNRAPKNQIELCNIKSGASLFSTSSVSLYSDVERRVLEYCGVDAMWALTLVSKSAHRWVKVLLLSTLVRHFARFDSKPSPRYTLPLSFSSHPLKVLKTLGSAPVFSSADSLLSGHCNGVQAIAFSPDGRYVVTASMDTTCRVWGQDSHEKWVCSDLLLGHRGCVHVISHSPFEPNFVSGSADNTCRVWEQSDNGKWKSLAPLVGHTSAVVNVYHSANDYFFVSSACDSTCFVWRRDSEQQWVASASLAGHRQYISDLALHPYKNELVTVSWSDSVCCVWSSVADDSSEWTITSRAQGHDSGITAVAYSPDGRFFVSGSKDCTARVWQQGRRNEWVCEQVLSEHKGAVVCLGFHPSCRYFITGSDDSDCILWSRSLAGQWRAAQRIRGDGAGVSVVSFGNDGSYCVTASQEQYYQVFQMQSNGSATLLEAWRDNIKSHTPCVGHSPDGCLFFASTAWGDCRLFPRARRVQSEQTQASSRCNVM